MKIAMTGATGLIGTRLVAALKARGDEVTVLSRSPQRAAAALGVEAVGWDALREPAPSAAFEGRSAVIHLAGEPVAQRWSADAKKAILDSREIGTGNLVGGQECWSRHRPSATTASMATR